MALCRSCSNFLLGSVESASVLRCKASLLHTSFSAVNKPKQLAMIGAVHFRWLSTEEMSGTKGADTEEKLPLMTSRQHSFPITYGKPRQAWIESLATLESKKLGMVDLHPDVFATYPRIDILAKNIRWQKVYREIDYRFEPNRAEMTGGGAKPWPQKGTGRARHGSNRSPIWLRGGKVHGFRGPTSKFYMLTRAERALGLRVALSCKYSQNDLIIVDSLDDVPTDDPEYMTEMQDVRFWGYSVLFVDDTDMMPENAALAIEQVTGMNLLPVYGLNVHSILKHDTLVLTLAALEKIEHKLLAEMHSTRRDGKFVTELTPEDFKTRAEKDNLMYHKFDRPLELNREFYDKPGFADEFGDENK